MAGQQPGELAPVTAKQPFWACCSPSKQIFLTNIFLMIENQ
jgi:hypothetical protein